MTPEEVEASITQFHKRAEDASAKGRIGDWSRYDGYAKKLEKWRDGGFLGNCPVDLAQKGIVLPAPEPAEESLEARSWRKELERAESLLKEKDDEKLAKAIVVLRRVVGAGEAAADLNEQAKRLLNEARVRRETRIGDLQKELVAARNDSKWIEAERVCRQILALDGTNTRTLADLATLRDSKEYQLQAIKEDLRRLDDIEALTRAVREAQALVATRQADEGLLELFTTGKEAWNQLRERHSMLLARMRLGSLETVADAVHEVEQCIFRGEMKVWDATLSEVMPTTRFLEEARGLWEAASRKEAAAEIALVERNLPHDLDWAARRLEEDLNKQFYDREDKKKAKPLGFIFCEEYRKELEDRLVKIKLDIKNRDAAAALIAQARAASDPQQVLTLLLEARSLWPHLVGMDQRIGEQRQMVATLLAYRMKAKMREMEAALREAELAPEAAAREEKFREARWMAAEAEQMAGQLPGEPLPVLTAALAEVKAVIATTGQREKVAAEWARHEADIRRLLESPDTYQQAIDLFDFISAKPELEGSSALEALRLMVAVFRNRARTR